MKTCDIGVACSKASKTHHTNSDGTFCNKHYLQMRRHGRIIDTSRDDRPAIIEGDIAKIPLGVNAKDGYAIVDKEFAYLADRKWGKTYYGYAKDPSTKELMHRFILGTKSGQVVDHKNGDRLDNRLSNIRNCTQAENSRNQNIKTSNFTGYKGVSYHKGAYDAQLKLNYKIVWRGRFQTAIEAAQAYNVAAKKYFGEFARLNDGI
jgi:hypothetical protein